MSKQVYRSPSAVRVGPVRQLAVEGGTDLQEEFQNDIRDGFRDRFSDSAPARDQGRGGGASSDESQLEPPRPRRSGARSGGRWLRLILPLAALATIAAVFWLSRPSYKDAAFNLVDGMKLSAGMEVANPRYLGETAEKEPFEINALMARPDGPDPSQIALDQVTGGIKLKDGKEAHLTASEGVWMRDTNKLRLTGGVTLKLSDGYEMETDAMLADIDSREIVTDGDVVGVGPVGRLEAGRGRFQDVDKGVAWFDGGVKVLITKLVESRATGE